MQTCRREPPRAARMYWQGAIKNGRGTLVNEPTRDRPIATSQNSFLIALAGNAFTTVLAGLALTNTTLPNISRLPALVAGFLRVFSMQTPGITNLPLFFTSAVATSASVSSALLAVFLFVSQDSAIAANNAPLVMGLEPAAFIIVGAISTSGLSLPSSLSKKSLNQMMAMMMMTWTVMLAMMTSAVLERGMVQKIMKTTLGMMLSAMTILMLMTNRKRKRQRKMKTKMKMMKMTMTTTTTTTMKAKTKMKTQKIKMKMKMNMTMKMKMKMKMKIKIMINIKMKITIKIKMKIKITIKINIETKTHTKTKTKTTTKTKIKIKI